MRIKTVRDVIKMRQHTPINYSEIEHLCPHDKEQMRMVELDHLPKQCTTEDIFRDKTFACMYASQHIIFSKGHCGLDLALLMLTVVYNIMATD